MKKSPYTLSEAGKICAEFQYLIGQPFEQDNLSTIDCVAIAPFDQVSKSRFIIYYLLFEDADMALTNEYKGLLYDVIVISGSAEKKELHHEDIYTWITKNKSLNEPAMEAAINFNQNYRQESQ